jgi:hypothetical protein
MIVVVKITAAEGEEGCNRYRREYSENVRVKRVTTAEADWVGVKVQVRFRSNNEEDCTFPSNGLECQ